MKNVGIIIAHSGLSRKIVEAECREKVGDYTFDMVHFIDFEIANASLSELYNLPFEQLALEQQRRFQSEIQPLLDQYPDATVLYFGLAPIPLAFHMGVMLNNFSNLHVFHFHHERKEWYVNTDSLKDYQFDVTISDLPEKVEKGKGDVFIRVATSYRIEPQHTHEVLANPTNEFDLSLAVPHVDGIATEEQLIMVIRKFQEALNAYANFLPDRDKIHLFISATTGVAFSLGTKINPNVYPYVQTYQYSKDESPKYREALLITKLTDLPLVISTEEKENAAKMRHDWDEQLRNKIIPFINSQKGTFNDKWFSQITQDEGTLKGCDRGAWENLPDLSRTSLSTDVIDKDVDTVDNGFKYDSAQSKWQIDDYMLLSLSKRLQRFANVDSLRAGRLFLFHESLHYAQDGHSLTEEIATGIGRFPKVIEEADYQADVWALLYDYKFSQLYDAQAVTNLKLFFLTAIDTAVETMWSFADNGSVLSQIQIRSMNRFLNWYWQWVRIERLKGQGTLKEIIEILFEKPIIEFAGAEVFVMDRQRICYKLSPNNQVNYELAIFYKNRIQRFAPTRIAKVLEGIRELDGYKIKEGLRSFLVTIE